MGARGSSASHRDLGLLVEEGKFRLDLYHRLSVFPIAIAPLRARGEDVLLLADYFVAEFGGRTAKSVMLVSAGRAETRALLLGFGWAGDVREPQTVIATPAIL